MSSRRPVALLVLGGLFTAAVLAFGSYSAVSLMAYQSTYTDVSFPHTEIQRLDISAVGSITIEPLPAGERTVTMTRRVQRGLTKPSYSETIVGDTLRIRTHCPVFGNTWCRVSYRIHIPASVSVVANSQGSGLHVHDIAADLDLKSDGGGIDVQNASGTLKLRSNGGGLRATGLRSRVVDADSNGGGLRLLFASAPDDVRAESSGGSAIVEVPKDETAYRADVSASGGARQVDVKTDPDSSHVIVIDSNGGSARLRYPEG